MISPSQRQIPRSSLVLLLWAQLLVLLPLVKVVPGWLLLLALLAWGWRFLLLQMRRALPAGWLKLLLVVGCLAAIFSHFGSLVILDAVVTLLCALYCLKFLEMRTQADAQRVCLLSFFVLGCIFLFSTNILITLYSSLVVVALVAVLVGLSRFSSGRLTVFADLKVAGRLLLQALPLMLLLFLFAPRLPPLWSVPLPADQARSGLSDEMAPGDIARLTQSDELVFRASFTGPIPGQSRLYWRALTLTGFDGRRWYRLDERQLSQRYGVPPEQLTQLGQSSPWQNSGASVISYELLLEPSVTPWLYSLASIKGSETAVRFTYDFNLQRPKGAVERSNYRLRSTPDAIRGEKLSNWQLRSNLQIPPGNERARALAKRFKERANGDSELLLQQLMDYYHQQPFFYTLRPPRLSGDQIDQFLFESQRGFCAHYAGSLVFLLRAAGVPARVVAGYQGGEIDPMGFVQVRQFDAHAWVEAWLPGRGWIRLDPTAQVSPARIEQGLAEATEAEGSFLSERPLSLLRYQDLAWINRVRRGWDRMEYRWQRWVVNFDQERQQSLLSDWLGDGVGWKSGVMLIGGMGSCLAIYLIFLWWHGRVRRSLLDQLFLSFCQKLKKQGVIRQPGETATQLVIRVRTEAPLLAERAANFERLYTRLCFDPTCPRQQESLRLLKRLLKKI